MDRNPYKGKTGLKRIWYALFYSLDGLRAAYISESAFRQEVAATLLLLPLALWLGDGALQRAVLIGSVLLVLIVELLNSAVEATVDRISFESSELAKRAKDWGSAAVFISLINCGVIWGLFVAERIT